MATDVLMPVLTEPGEDGVVTAWFVDEGQLCEAGQLIAEIQVQKVAEGVYTDEAGAVAGLVPINAPVPQGEAICRIVAAEEVGVDIDVVASAGSQGTAPEMAGLRTVIARNLRRGHLETAPVTLTSEVDLGSGLPEHMTAVVIKAVAIALKEHPGLNGTRDGDRFTPAEAINVAVAIQTEDGLVAPIVRNPGDHTVAEIHEEIRVLAERARNRELAMADYEGGTFSVSNLGSYGVDGFTPIINLPQVAILGVGAVRRVPVISDGGTVTEGSRVVLSLTFDHAFIDGVPAAEFLRRVGAYLGSGG